MTILRLALSLLFIVLITPGVVGSIDVNNNKIEDSLEFEMSTTADVDAAVDVIVLYDRQTDIPLSIGKVKYNFSIINATALRIPRSSLYELTEKPNVEMVYPDRVVHAYLDSSVPVIRADVARNTYNLSGSNITIAIIDTGIDASHEWLDDLDDNSSTDDPKVIAFKDYVNFFTEPYDDDGHGTHCAAIAAGTGGGTKYTGVAVNANLVGVKVLDKTGYGSDSDVIAGLEWCVEKKNMYRIKIISMSLGDDYNNNGTTPLEMACDHAVDNGIVVCVAAGNDGNDTATVGDPACAKKVITVGSVDDDITIADSSSRGPTLDGRIKPEVCAVGVSVTSAKAGTAGGYVTMSGTSMTAPHVAGVAALMLEYNPDLTPDRVRQILMDTATDRGETGPDNNYGWGVVNATDAILHSAEEHDISILKLEASSYVEPNRSMTINVTVKNIGINNESNVTMFLRLNETMLNQTIIPSIRTKESIDVSFSWVPVEEGCYNLSVNVSAVTGETLLDDNMRYAIVNVSHNPDIWIEPPNYDFDLVQGSSAARNLTIGNSGTLPLAFNVTILTNYQMEDIQYNWIDGVSDGTNLNLGDDSISSQILPFVFNFYGNNYSSINISSDGWASFTSGDEWMDWMYGRGARIPMDDWENTIFPLGDDWNASIGGGVYINSSHDRYIITWYQLPHWYDGVSYGNNSFEMILYKNGEIEFNYMRVENTETLTVGLNLGDGLHGIGYMDIPQNNTSLRFKPEKWLSIRTVGGTIPADGKSNVTIEIDAADLDCRRYQADILIECNDPDEGSIIIPVNNMVWGVTSARTALEIAVGSREYDPGLDVNSDGRITSLDALIILQKVGA
ncbi:MAG: Subtilase family protein [Candidatus Argoarchaeum ethanivorans]|uniref:Subtilase family protein n=1 Tax=Candidatus Argoarchaeum ethanivorans TaxID=2608793 RepID=A0A811T705_9EURY|nr:MAG: Subtilase family protein [Candidatus Argoarchaeum ethanivorans]CAD6493808.1 MAG: Subtilase family protein [Candidatus Argoarchaeum ethanivorans]